MKTNYIFWGTLLITIGVIALLNNFGSIDVDWSSIWKLWPLIFILWGVTLLVNSILFKGIIVGLTAIVLAVTIFAAIKSTFGFITDGFHITVNDEDWENTTSTNYAEPFKPDVKKAELNFDAGAGTFLLKDTSADLFYATARGKADNYTLSKNFHDSTAVINFKMKDTHISITDGEVRNKVNIELSNEPSWDMNFDIGAASVDFDLSPYKIENLTFETGAASLKIKLGELSEVTKFKLDAGASSIDIFIPVKSGCEIKTDARLSSKHFEGFKKVNDNLYRTENFESAGKKIYLDIDAGVSSLSVNRAGW